MNIITLTSDYGNNSHYIASIKGSLLNHITNIHIVDVTHGIQKFDKIESAFVLTNSYKNFTDGSIHLICVETNILEYKNSNDIIKKFVNLLPVYNKHSKNLFGVRPYDRSLEQLNYFTSMFMDKKIINDLIEISQNTITKKTQIQSEMRYHREIYMMMDILLNHYFYLMGKQYINGWTHDEQKSLDQLLKMKSNEIPLLITLFKLKSTDKDLYLQNVINDNMDSNLKIKHAVIIVIAGSASLL